MNREKILDRIRRLLRLSESANVNEAASAAARAQELMARHRIEVRALEAEHESDIRDFRDAPLDASKRLRPWKVALADGIARANGCRAYVLERGKDRTLVLVGRVEDAELVRALYTELVPRVEALTRRAGMGRDRAYCNAFRVGVVTTLAERLERATAEAKTRCLMEPATDEDEGEGTSLRPERTALALARLDEDDDAVERFMERTMRLTKGRSLRVDAEGYAHGRVSGHAVALDPGPTSKGRRR